VGALVDIVLGIGTSDNAPLEEAAVGAQLGFSEHAVSTGRRGIITLAMALPKFILMEHLLNEDRLQYYQYLNIRN
jgi:hypothetical protein